ncbi:MAG: ribulose-phosphate 3-epimerase [Endomicrobiia bacterium]
MKNNLRKILNPLPTIAVSLLDSDLANLATITRKLQKNKVKIFHLDIMDGHFVPNLTFGPPLIKSLRNHTKVFFNVHLMIENPQNYISDYINAGADLIVFHYESVKKRIISQIIGDIKKSKIFCGIAIKPATPIKVLFPFLNIIDLVLIMTVEPGFGGQKIIKSCISKISLLKNYKEANNLDFIISCDGGINEHNLKEILDLGCEIPVMGHAIFSSSDYVKKVKILQRLTNSLKFHKYTKNE